MKKIKKSKATPEYKTMISKFKKTKMTNADISRITNIDKSYIGKIKNGNVIPTSPTVNRILEAFFKNENNKEDLPEIIWDFPIASPDLSKANPKK